MLVRHCVDLINIFPSTGNSGCVFVFCFSPKLQKGLFACLFVCLLFFLFFYRHNFVFYSELSDLIGNLSNEKCGWLIFSYQLTLLKSGANNLHGSDLTADAQSVEASRKNTVPEIADTMSDSLIMIRPGLGCVTTHWHQQEHQGLGCVATH